MPLPNFIICGAHRSGTTSLYHYLVQHPAIFLSPKKEIHYFSKNYSQGEAWYRQHFGAGKSAKITGEASASYMDGKDVPGRMHRLIPNTSLGFLLRNPVNRAYSAYWFGISFKQNPDESFSEAIRSEHGHDLYIKQGFYYQYILNYLRFFDRSQMLFILTEDLESHPLEQVSSCFEFLKVDAGFIPDVQQRFNVSQPATNSVSVFIQRRWRRIKLRLLKSQMISPSFRRQTSKFRANLGKYLTVSSPDQKQLMLPEDRAYLENIYHDHNTRLSEFLDHDLPWGFPPN